MKPVDPSVPLPHLAQPLSVELAQLRDAFAGRTATLREVIGALGDRAYELIMILLALPFLLPVAVPGMSTPLGFAVAGIAIQLALGRLPWLPQRLLDRPLPAGFLTKVLGVTQGVVKFLERALRPRWLALTGGRWLNGLHLFVMFMAALLLALPLPIPFTNTLPGWTILLLAAGLVERDGLVILTGYVAMIATIALFFAVGAAIDASLSAAWHWLVG